MQALRAGRVFDGSAMVGPATVVVRDGFVEAVERGEVAGAEDLGEDVTLLPGLVDTHVHLAFDGGLDTLPSMEVDDEALLKRMHAMADLQLRAGVTTVRDLGDRGFLATQLDTPLTVLASGPPLTTPQGHCWFLGGEVEGVEAMLRAVQERADRGCAVVKVMVSGGNITPGSSPFQSQFSAEQLRPVVAEAHRLGMHTAAHCHAPGSVLAALDVGFDTLEHMTFMTEAGVEPPDGVLQRLVDSGTWISATLGLIPGGGAPPPALASRLGLVTENMMWLAAHGARIVVGTDSGVGPPKQHGCLPYAMNQLTPGLSPLDALRAITSQAAAAIRLAGRKGTLTKGADADLLAVQGDPEVDIEALHRVVGVWTRGERLRR